MSLLESVERAVAVVARSGHECALIGGLAVSARCEPRFTRDADLAVAVVDDTAAEAVSREFMATGYRIGSTLEQTEADRLSGTRLVDPEGVSVDLLFASSGIEPEVVERSERLRIADGMCLPVASVGDLLALKLLSVDERRATDRTDLRALADVATPEDWSVAEGAVALIESRGFHRGRDLTSALAGLRVG